MRLLTPYVSNRDVAGDFFSEIDQFFNGFDREIKSRFYDERSFSPACEVAETDEHYLMSVDLPGMKKEDIKIEVKDNILTISGERKKETTSDSKSKIQRYERTYGFFKRSFSLPASLNSEAVEARYENGVLELYLPKSQAARSRQIEIQSGKAGIFEKLLGSKKTSQDVKDVG